jgi:hypothetical protein
VERAREHLSVTFVAEQKDELQETYEDVPIDLSFAGWSCWANLVIVASLRALFDLLLLIFFVWVCDSALEIVLVDRAGVAMSARQQTKDERREALAHLGRGVRLNEGVLCQIWWCRHVESLCVLEGWVVVRAEPWLEKRRKEKAEGLNDHFILDSMASQILPLG